MELPTLTQLREAMDERASKIFRSLFVGSRRSKVDPGYGGSGDFKTRDPNETATPNITIPVLLAFGLANETGEAAASDDIVKTPDGKYVMGKIGTPGGSINADKWGGRKHVTPGNTTTLLSADTERNTTNTTFTEGKRVVLAEAGRYRVSMELARSANTTEAKLQLLLLDGVTWLDVSSVAQSTTTYPSFSSHNVDQTITANWPGAILRVVYRQVTAGTSYIKNVRVKFDLIKTAPALHSAVITD